MVTLVEANHTSHVYTFAGDSTDIKPTQYLGTSIAPNSLFRNMDTNTVARFTHEGEWVDLPQAVCALTMDELI